MKLIYYKGLTYRFTEIWTDFREMPQIMKMLSDHVDPHKQRGVFGLLISTYWDISAGGGD